MVAGLLLAILGAAGMGCSGFLAEQHALISYNIVPGVPPSLMSSFHGSGDRSKLQHTCAIMFTFRGNCLQGLFELFEVRADGDASHAAKQHVNALILIYNGTVIVTLAFVAKFGSRAC